MKPDITAIPPVEELIPEKRKRLSKRAKLELILQFPRCSVCKKKLGDLADVQFDHDIPRGLGHPQLDDNWRPLHRRCHVQKTAADRKTMAKVNRIRDKRFGDTRPKRKIPSRAFQKKPKIDKDLS